MSTKPRYSLIEGFSDWVSAYIIAGSVAIISGGGLWLLFGIATLLIIILTFSTHFTKIKLAIYVLALVFCLLVFWASVQNDFQTNPPILSISLSILQILLIFLYYKRKLMK